MEAQKEMRQAGLVKTFYPWILQVQVKKSLLSRAACDTYLAQRFPAAGTGKQTDGEVLQAAAHCSRGP